jgi:hypothetical protein
MRGRIATEDGQILPLLAAGLLVAILGFAGLAIDLGSWYRAQRHAQAVADAAALAAVQALPGSPATAATIAQQYANLNGGTIDAPAIAPDGTTIDVVAHADVPAYFARVFGFSVVTVKAQAHAEAKAAVAVANAAPMAVSVATPALQCGAACFGQPVTLTFGKLGAGGAFGLMNFSQAPGVPTPTLASWIASGYPGMLPLGAYRSAPGNRWNSAPVRSALAGLASRHAIILVPVYSGTPTGSGAQATYDVVGFAAFRIDSFVASGAISTATGAFVELITHGTSGQGGEYFGVKSVKLTEPPPQAHGGNGNGNGNGNGGGATSSTTTTTTTTTTPIPAA